MSDLYLILLILLRGTWIILKFVKDKDNLLPHDVWTGTDYTQTTSSFTKNDNLTSSTEWSYNGDRCLKLTRRTEDYAGYTTEYYQDFPKGNYKFTLKVYNPDNNGGSITLFCNEGNESVQYTQNNNVQTITIEVSNKTVIGFRISVYSSLKSVYLDEFKITSQ